MKCIVRGKGLPKVLHYIMFREPQPACDLPKVFGGMKIHEKAEGDRDVYMDITTIYTSKRPRSKEEAQLLTNQPVIRAPVKNGVVTQITTWDGESYQDKYFCSDKCCRMQGYASAHHGARFTWSA